MSTALSRWENPGAFPYNSNHLCDSSGIKKSVASCINFNASAVHDYIMSSDRSKWIKIPAMIVLDAALLATAPIVSVAEAVVRLAIAIITSPLLLAKICTDEKWTDTPAYFFVTAFYSLLQIPNTLSTIYQTFTSDNNFDPYSDGVSTFNNLTEDIDDEQYFLSFAGVVHILVANLIGMVQGSDAYGWFKGVTVFVLDATLCLTVPMLAVADAVLRLAVAIITSPLALVYCCSTSKLYEVPSMAAVTVLYSLSQIPNTVYTVYQSFCGDGSRIKVEDNVDKFICFD